MQQLREERSGRDTGVTAKIAYTPPQLLSSSSYERLALGCTGTDDIGDSVSCKTSPDPGGCQICGQS